MAARTEMRQAPGGRGGKKDPNGLTLGVTGLSFSCMDLVDPKRDFLLTLNESAQSRIAVCITCITGVIVIFFFLQEGGVGGCPSPPYLANSSKTEIHAVVGRKNFSESTYCRNEDFRETRQCDVL